MPDLDDPFDQIVDAPFDDALSQRYLVYALSTITARSLPDVRDGLKPVHRRLLWGMRLLRLDPAAGYKKCARVVGDVMGKYHPHGDQSIYDAMVLLPGHAGRGQEARRADPSLCREQAYARPPAGPVQRP